MTKTSIDLAAILEKHDQGYFMRTVAEAKAKIGKWPTYYSTGRPTPGTEDCSLTRPMQ